MEVAAVVGGELEKPAAEMGLSPGKASDAEM